MQYADMQGHKICKVGFNNFLGFKVEANSGLLGDSLFRYTAITRITLDHYDVKTEMKALLSISLGKFVI